MALDSTEVRAGLTGSLSVAPIGSTMPTDTTTALDVAFVHLGYLSPDAISMSVDTNREDFSPWQSTTPVRSIITEQTLALTFTLWQRNADTLKLAFGGGTVALSGLGPDRVYTPPPVGIDERAFVLEVQDGTIIDRYLFYRGVPSLSGEVNFQREELTGFEIEVTLLTDETEGVPFKLITNDAAVPADA